jgi:hypothetical protein
MTYGCYNREPFRPHVHTEAVEVMWSDKEPLPKPEVVMRSWPNVFTKDCQYTKTELGKVDPGCVGCKWKHQ